MTIIVATIVGLLVGVGATYLAVRAQLRERDSLRVDLDTARTAAGEAAQAAAADRARLQTIEEKLPETVKAISGEALTASREGFLAEAGLKIGATLGPVQKQLEEMGKLVGGIEKERQQTTGRIDETLKALSEQTGSLALRLGSAQTRGRWGEEQLEILLDHVGMKETIDYDRQTTGDGGRPDIVLHLPGGKHVVIDAKTPFDAFEEAEAAATPEERNTLLAAYAKRVRDHVTALGKKDYAKHITPAPDFVFMFLPGDAFVSAAEEHDRGLFAHASDKNVIIATPRTILVLLRTIRIAWQNENASENARRVLEVAGQVHERLEKFVKHLTKLGTSLDSTIEAYNAAVSSYGTRLLPAVRRLEGLAPPRNELRALPEVTEHSHMTGGADLVEDDPDTP